MHKNVWQWLHFFQSLLRERQGKLSLILTCSFKCLTLCLLACRGSTEETWSFAGLKLPFMFFCLSRLQGWVPPAAGPGLAAGASADWRAGEITPVRSTVRSPVSHSCLYPSAGCTCWQLHLLHCALPLFQPLTNPHWVPAQHPEWAPSPSLSKQRRGRDVAVWRALLAVSVWQGWRGSREGEVAREERPRESQERGQSWQRRLQSEQAGGLHRGQRPCSFAAAWANPSGWCVWPPEGPKPGQREQSAAKRTFTKQQERKRKSATWGV